MAYRGGAAPWVLSATFFVFTATFGAMYFSQQDEMQKIRKMLEDETHIDLAKDHPSLRISANKDMLAMVKNTQDLERKIQAMRDEKKAANEEIVALTAEKQGLIQKNQELNNVADTEKKVARIAKSKASEIKLVAENLYAQEQTELKTEIEGYREGDDKSKDLISSLKEKLNKVTESKAEMNDMAIRRKIDLRHKITALQSVINEINKTSGTRAVLRSEIYDGKVLKVDLQQRRVIVNLGKIHHVTAGMRFDVIRNRRNKWETMGTIELTKVNATTSIGLIRDASTSVKRDPDTGAIYTDPEARYSEYSARGKDQRVVRLQKISIGSKSTMKEFDPIVEGDFITNPFYSKNKKYRFCVAGEKVHYTKREIEQQIKRYGGIVQDKVETTTDFLVLGMVYDDVDLETLDDDAAERQRFAKKMIALAETYKIPIMREVTLFNFLRN